MKPINRPQLEKIVKLNGQAMKQMIVAAASWLKQHQAEVDALNVFPVPDGDTGTNMYLTIFDAAKEAKKIEEESVSAVANALANGSLMGARGNSGVILSQLFRGFANGLKGKKEVTAKDLANALSEASQKAYKAVMKPVEGTILTVARKAGETAIKAAEAEDDIISLLESTLAGAKLSLAQTPDLLPILKESNVVDAGGKGYCFILEGYIRSLKGEKADLSDLTLMPSSVQSSAQTVTELEFIYCTEFLLKGKNIQQDKLRADLSEYGDSLLVVGSSEVIKIHVHTNNPGLVLDYVSRYGKMSKIKIDNMEEQAQAKNQNDEKLLANKNPLVTALAKKEYGIIAVVAGEGLTEIFESMGADIIVSGGQSMNPSTQDLARACETIPADKIVILPNNKNIIFAAEQVKEICSKQITVIPTRSIPQGIAALIRFNPEIGYSQTLKEMEFGFKDVKSGEVTFAVRDSKINGLNIKKGDIIGLFDGEIKVSNKDINKVSLALLELMVEDEDFLITIYRGSDITEQQSEELQKQVEAKFDECDVEIYPGDQPLYYYIMSVE